MSHVSPWLIVVFFVGATLIALHLRNLRVAFWSVVALSTAILLTKLTLVWRPWWPRHVLVEVRPLGDLLSEPFFLPLHALIYLGSLVGVWFVERHATQVRKTIKFLLVSVVFVAVGFDTCMVAHLIRRLESDDAKATIRTINSLTANLLADERKHLLVTSGTVIRDQAIAKISSNLYWIIKDEFPEIALMAISLHMRPSSPRFQDQVWNVIQIGRESKAREFLPLHRADGSPGSLAAAAMVLQPPRRVYCPDVSNAPKGRPDCRFYQQPPTETIEYTSLACFPLPPAVGVTPFAALCLDGGGAYRWDDRLDEIKRLIDENAAGLYSLLAGYREGERCLFRAQDGH
jgi:hypothetical protein